MKERLKRILFAVFLLLPLAQAPCEAETPQEPIRGVWISSVLNLDYPSKQGLSAEELKQEADAILEKMAESGLNAAFLQVRPCADALYASKIFPYSVYLTGTQGGSPGVDPLAYFSKKAHEKGIAVHAWINPYRVTKGAPGSIENGLAQLAEWNPARQNPGWVRLGADGNLYFDPGLPEVRRLILQGALELATQYDLDGIHLDDYFYPSGAFDDSAAYSLYGAGKTLEEFRRDSVNQLISSLSEQLHREKPTILFGVSPAGIWANESSMAEGSKTAGSQSYFDQYADSRAWVKNGWVDYISPQLYWYCGQEGSDFTTLLQWWRQQVEGTKCRLLPGLAAYKAMADDPASPWYGTQELRAQLGLIDQQEKSWILFRFGNIKENPALLQSVPQAEGESGGKLEIARPQEDCITAAESFYFCGISDAGQPLIINDIVVTQRDAKGRWGYLAPLNWGANEFVIHNGEQSITRKIFRTEEKNARPIEPQGNCWVAAGETAEFFCPAPTGSVVSLRLGSRQYVLTQRKNGGYSAALYLPRGAKDAVTQFGHPMYVSFSRGAMSVKIAPGQVCSIGEEVALGCTVTKDLCDVYYEADAKTGCRDFWREGMSAPVKRIKNSMVDCGSGWLKEEDVKISSWAKEEKAKITPISATIKKDGAELVFSGERLPAAVCSYEKGSITLRFLNAVASQLPQGEAIAQASAQIDGGDLIYHITMNDFSPAGWYWKIKGDQLILTIRPKKKCEEGTLKGLKIMLDAGHGGAASGAIGCDPAIPEKQTNLELALLLQKELKSRGATVIMTREKDDTVELRERFLKSFKEMPDVFLSLHSNSAEDSVDLTRYAGIGLYCNQAVTGELAQKLSDTFAATGRQSLPMTADSKLYLCRQDFTQAILVENGFLPNPNEFDQIILKEEQQKLCAALADGIESYYHN